MPIKVIARVMKVSRNTVRAAIASDRPPRYERPAKRSIVDAAEPRIRELLQACPTMPATVIAERIGWDRSVRVLRDRVAELRPAYLPADPASRAAYERGVMALLIPSRAAGDLFGGWWQLVSGLGAVPRGLVWDGEGAIGRWRAGRV